MCVSHVKYREVETAALLTATDVSREGNEQLTGMINLVQMGTNATPEGGPSDDDQSTIGV